MQRWVSAERFAVYRAVAGSDDAAVGWYLWDRDTGNAILRDLALVEVALRNALQVQLESVLGERWFCDPLMGTERRVSRGCDRAVRELARFGKPVTSAAVTAQVSLGFWVSLLNRTFDSLWRDGLHLAFPGGRRQAGMAGERYGRSWVLSQLQVVRQLRNRCAHQEPLVRGFPMPNVRHRLDVGDGVAAYMRVAAMLDRDLARFMGVDSTVPRLLARRPVGRQ